MKKIILIQHCGVVGGSGLGLLTTARMLEKDFNVVIYCPDKPEGMFLRYEKEGFDVRPLPAPLPTYGYYNGGPELFTRSNLAAFKTCCECIPLWRETIIAEKADYLLVNSLVMSWMYKCVEGTDCKSICHVREVLRSTKTFCGKRIIEELEHFDSVWYISDNERKKQALKKPVCLTVRDCLQKDTATDNVSGADASYNDGKFHLLFVGGSSYLKGFHTVIKAAKKVDDNVIIDIAGHLDVDKPKFTLGNLLYFQRFFRFAKIRKCVLMTHNLQNVTLVGYCDDLNKLYSSCDALAFPSNKAHQARPAFEAGIYAKPVIISDFPDTRDNVINGVNGLTFKPNSPRALAKAVNRLAGDSAFAEKLGKANRESSLDCHSYETVEDTVKRFMKGF